MMPLLMRVRLDMGLNIMLFKTIISVGGDLVQVRHHTELKIRVKLDMGFHIRLVMTCAADTAY